MSLGLRVRPFRFPLIVAYDVTAWIGATLAATGLRYTSLSAVPWKASVVLGIALAAVYVLVGLAVRLHQGRARTGSLEEMLLVAVVAAFSGMVVFAANSTDIVMARSVPVGATISFVVVAGLGRATWRAYAERPQWGREAAAVPTRALIAGAGDAGRDLVISMLRDPRREWLPVGLVDDDRAKRHLRIRGVPVLGDTWGIREAVERCRADVLVVAIPSTSAETLARIAEAGRTEGLEVKVLPSTSELLREHVGIRDIRDIHLADVLGRNQVDTDIASIADYLSGKRVLVTGAGGSIGSELCRQIARFGPGELIMLDRDESALHAVQLSLTGRALLDDGSVVLCDIRDTVALNRVFMSRRPDVVFHAAALKHLPMLEQYPGEAIKTNVVGTRNVLGAAHRAGVPRLVNVSTDKAANPSCVLGYSKRLAERVTSSFAEATSRSYLSVRFGNVLGSRGSVLTTFAQQIAQGGPVTVTHPEVTRYFMTVEEACELVVQAGAIGGPGEVLVLDMGAPVKILEVAQHLIRLEGRPIRIEYTGLREGEKLHEELFGRDEPRDLRPWHASVSHVPVTPLDLRRLEELPHDGPRAFLLDALVGACDEDRSCDNTQDWTELLSRPSDLRDTVGHYDD
jgi:FlaA1/EpsC-like NDP-sugar epimerase